MTNFELISFGTADELARAVAGAWLAEVEAATRGGKSHYAALSGGRSAKTFFSAVVEESRAKAVSLHAVHFFWADERCVPPKDSESNFRMAQEDVFFPLKISDSRIHRINGEKLPDVAASEAAAEIRRIVPANANGQPALDLIFLGMGEDGHVASLFPDESESVRSDKAVYRAIKNSPKPPPNRVTLGYGAIVAARQVWVLASGAGKAAALRESLAPSGRTPLARVLQSRLQTRDLFRHFVELEPVEVLRCEITPA